MASASQSLRLALRGCRGRPALQRSAPRPLIACRSFSQTPTWRKAAKEDEAIENTSGSEELDAFTQSFTIEQAMAKALTAEERTALAGSLPQGGKDLDAMRKALGESKTVMGGLKRRPKPGKNTFWHEDEPDSELLTDEQGEDDFEEDDILSLAHGKLEEHREWREYARLLVYDLPLLAKHAKVFEPPTAATPLRFRYTSYMGEFHPAEKKVVVEFSPADLDLTEVQQAKLKKLSGPRYNPEKEIVHISCEAFEHQAQNKRYLGELVNKLIAEAKDPKDTFEDIPLDTRHHTFKTKAKFPREWRMSEERKRELQQIRQKSFLLDEAKKTEGTLVDGQQRIQLALDPPKPDMSDKVAELVAAHPLTAGSPQRPGRR